MGYVSTFPLPAGPGGEACPALLHPHSWRGSVFVKLQLSSPGKLSHAGMRKPWAPLSCSTIRMPVVPTTIPTRCCGRTACTGTATPWDGHGSPATALLSEPTAIHLSGTAHPAGSWTTAHGLRRPGESRSCALLWADAGAQRLTPTPLFGANPSGVTPGSGPGGIFP